MELLISKAHWNSMVLLAKDFEVENDETPLHKYSVRTRTNTIVVWTREGWQECFFQYKLLATRKGRSKNYIVEIVPGTAPPSKQWSDEEIMEDLAELFKRATKETFEAVIV